VCRYNWHSATFLGWPFPMLKYRYIFQIKYTEAILSNSTRKLLWFEITKMLIAVLRNKFIVLFIIIFGTLSFPISPEKLHVRCIYSPSTSDSRETRRRHRRQSTSDVWHGSRRRSRRSIARHRLICVHGESNRSCACQPETNDVDCRKL